MSIKERLTDMVRNQGLRLTLETLAAICVDEAERGADRYQDASEWRDWHKAKDRLLKMSQDMIL